MTRGLKAYLLAGGLVLGLHGLGGSMGWWKGVKIDFGDVFDVRSGSGGSSGWHGSGGFRGGK